MMVRSILVGAAILHAGHGGRLHLLHRARLCRERHALRGEPYEDANQQQDVKQRSHCAVKMTAGSMEVNSPY